ncbi:hypothetical protein C8A01DRAFT_13546, partial [Parachaetomium inaequale]
QRSPNQRRQRRSIPQLMTAHVSLICFIFRSSLSPDSANGGREQADRFPAVSREADDTTAVASWKRSKRNHDVQPQSADGRLQRCLWWDGRASTSQQGNLRDAPSKPPMLPPSADKTPVPMASLLTLVKLRRGASICSPWRRAQRPLPCPSLTLAFVACLVLSRPFDVGVLLHMSKGITFRVRFGTPSRSCRLVSLETRNGRADVGRNEAVASGSPVPDRRSRRRLPASDNGETNAA